MSKYNILFAFLLPACGVSPISAPYVHYYGIPEEPIATDAGAPPIATDAGAPAYLTSTEQFISAACSHVGCTGWPTDVNICQNSWRAGMSQRNAQDDECLLSAAEVLLGATCGPTANNTADAVLNGSCDAIPYCDSDAGAHDIRCPHPKGVRQ
jgi:hypothetical protein